MKKVFEYLGIITIMLGSFIYTEKTTSAVKELDSIMVEIKKISHNYYIPKIEAVIGQDTIIPGMNGKQIDIDKSYYKMKAVGFFTDNYLEFEEIKVNQLLTNNYDKYIVSGNENKKTVSIIIYVKKEDDIDKILKLVNSLGVKVNFFIDGYVIENNERVLRKIINKGHEIGTTGYNKDYTNSSYAWLDTKIKKLNNSKHSYCIKQNKEALEICARKNNFSLDPIYIDNDYLYRTKKYLNSGAIISYSLNDSLIKEMPLIIKYIKSKGLKIDTLNNLLKE